MGRARPGKAGRGLAEERQGMADKVRLGVN